MQTNFVADFEITHIHSYVVYVIMMKIVLRGRIENKNVIAERAQSCLMDATY